MFPIQEKCKIICNEIHPEERSIELTNADLMRS